VLVSELVTKGFCKNLEGSFLGKDGSTLTGLISAKVILIKGIPHIFSMVRDITNRKLAEEANKIILSKYEVLFDIFPVGITISDASGKVLESNPIAETLLGISREEHSRRKIDGMEWRIIRPDGKEMEASEYASVRALAEGKPVTNVEMGIVKENNQITWLNVSATPIPIEGYGVAIIYGDITDRKKSLAALKLSEEKLRELNATKDKFFTIIAHDLKNPFNAILGLSELLKEEVQNLDNPTIVSYTNVIHSTTQQTLKLLENLLDWAGMQHGGFHFQPKELKLKNLIEFEIKAQEYIANQKNLTIHFNLQEEILLTADEKMLGSTIRNLISNAIMFTPRNGKIILEAKKSPGHVEVSISDNGVGIRMENLGKLFKTEMSFTSRGTEDERGTGLGLLLCKEFVERHGGSIRVDSKMGKGSRFTFSLPNRD
jgi:PAS domain S-box-containing protein